MHAGTDLSQAPLNTKLRLVSLTAPNESRSRLASLGLRQGATFSVLQKTAGGGRVLSVGGSRIALGSRLLPLLQAEDVN